MNFRPIPSISTTVSADADIQSELKLNLVGMVKTFFLLIITWLFYKVISQSPKL